MERRPFAIDEVLARIEEAVRPYPPAAMFQLADEGFDSIFEQLIACIISIRTYDETTLPTARKLFAEARTPQAMAALTPAQIGSLIADCTFHENKAHNIHAIAQETVQTYGGRLPADPDVLQGFKGVGPKCAHLALGVASDLLYISVDVHVHRITNRWGYVDTNSPEKTMRALEAKLPEKYWVTINRLLVPFGKHVCTGRAPRCSTCPVFAMCRQVGVRSYR